MARFSTAFLIRFGLGLAIATAGVALFAAHPGIALAHHVAVTEHGDCAAWETKAEYIGGPEDRKVVVDVVINGEVISQTYFFDLAHLGHLDYYLLYSRSGTGSLVTSGTITMYSRVNGKYTNVADQDSPALTFTCSAPTATRTPTATATAATPVPTSTSTPTRTATATATQTPSGSGNTATPTRTPPGNASATATPISDTSATATPNGEASATATPTDTGNAETPTSTAQAEGSVTPVPTATSTVTRRSATPTATGTATPTAGGPPRSVTATPTLVIVVLGETPTPRSGLTVNRLPSAGSGRGTAGRDVLIVMGALLVIVGGTTFATGWRPRR